MMCDAEKWYVTVVMIQVEELEEKHQMVATLEEEQEKVRRFQMLAEDKARKEVKEAKKQLAHERELKLEAFQRVDQLQSQVTVAWAIILYASNWHRLSFVSFLFVDSGFMLAGQRAAECGQQW